MKKPNLIILIIMLVLIAAVAVLAMLMPQSRTIPQDALSLITAQPTAAEAPQATASAEPTAVPQTAAYLVVSVKGMLYEPLPLGGEGSFTIKQDENTANTVHVTPDSIWMEHSTCDNQDCVDQGVVSLENMNTRVLTNMIICLPNDVVLELHTPETLKEAFGVAF